MKFLQVWKPAVSFFLQLYERTCLSQQSERCYNAHRFYSLADFDRQLAARQSRSSLRPMRSFHRAAPRDVLSSFTVQYVDKSTWIVSTPQRSPSFFVQQISFCSTTCALGLACGGTFHMLDTVLVEVSLMDSHG